MEKTSREVKYSFIAIMVEGDKEIPGDLSTGKNIPFNKLKPGESMFYVEGTAMPEIIRIIGPFKYEEIKTKREQYKDLLEQLKKNERKFPFNVYQLTRVE